MGFSHLHDKKQALYQHLTFLINHKDTPAFEKDKEEARKTIRRIIISLDFDLKIGLDLVNIQSLLPPS